MKECPLIELRPASGGFEPADLDRICATPRGIAGGWLALLVVLLLAGGLSAALPAAPPTWASETRGANAARSSDPGPLASVEQQQVRR